MTMNVPETPIRPASAASDLNALDRYWRAARGEPLAVFSATSVSSFVYNVVQAAFRRLQRIGLR
jgi:hypothetical protein